MPLTGRYAEWKDGAFEITGGALNQTTWNIARKNYNDFSMEVDAQLPESDSGSSYGLVFHFLDQSTAYFFALTQDGKYALMRRTYGQNNFVIQPTASNAINAQGSNRLVSPVK